MAPLSAWLPTCPNQDFDLVVKIVGPGAFALFKESWPITQFLVDHGFAVMSECGQLNGNYGDFVLDLRVSSQPFYSMGHGCDILLYLGDHVPDLRSFNLQRGSVLVWESPRAVQLDPILPEGVIVYSIPLRELSSQHVEGPSGKGIVAIGVLLYLLGVSEKALYHLVQSITYARSLAAGWGFARRTLKKHDVYSLPLSYSEEQRRRMLFTPEQAIMLGYALGSCECGTACDRELVASSVQWTAKHLGIGGAMVSVLESEGHPGVQVYRGPEGKVMAFLRGDDSVIASCINGFLTPRVFIAADIPDALKLIVAGHDLIRSGSSDGIGVLIEDTIALRHQSIDIDALIELIHREDVPVQHTIRHSMYGGSFPASERDGDVEADIGYVAWGAAQGVVRDAVNLSRSFGLRVSGYYPKLVVPFSNEDMESFAKTVGQVVLVESGQRRGYWDRVRATFSFESTVLSPLSGKSLTPMDIFLREGLGA